MVRGLITSFIKGSIESFRSPNWQVGFFLVAAVTVETLAVSLYLNHRIVRIHEESTSRSLEVSKLEEGLLELSQMALGANAAGFRSFNSNETEDGGKAAYLAGYKQFRMKLHQVMAAVEASKADYLKSSIMVHLDAAKASLFSVNWEVGEIFSAYQDNDMGKAVSHLSQLENHYEDLSLKIGRAMHDGRVALNDLNEAQLQDVKVLRMYLWWSALGALWILSFMVAYVFWIRAFLWKGSSQRGTQKVCGANERPGLVDIAKVLANRNGVASGT